MCVDLMGLIYAGFILKVQGVVYTSWGKTPSQSGIITPFSDIV